MKDKNKNRLMKAGILALLLAMSGGQAWASVVMPEGDNTASADGAVAMGLGNNAQGDGAVAMGRDNTSNLGTAVGNSNKANNSSIAFGNGNQAIGELSVAIGGSNLSAAGGGSALGWGSWTYQTNSTALGFYARIYNGTNEDQRAGGSGATAIGTHVAVTSNNGTAMGYKVSAAGVGSFAAGSGTDDGINGSDLSVIKGTRETENYGRTLSKGNFSIAVGYITRAEGTASVAVGAAEEGLAITVTDRKQEGGSWVPTDSSEWKYWQNDKEISYDAYVARLTMAKGENSTAIGTASQATQKGSVAVGTYAAATGTYAVSIGAGASADNKQTASGANAIALGSGNTASAARATAVGYHNIAKTQDSVAIGAYNNATGQNALAIGYGNSDSEQQAVSGSYAQGVGFRNTASNTRSVAYGYLNTSSGLEAVSFGTGNKAQGSGSIAIGSGTLSSDGKSVTTYQEAIGNYSVVVGNSNIANSANSQAIGSSNTVKGSRAIAYGYSNKVYVETDTAQTEADDAIAIGSSNKAQAQEAVAIGSNNNASGVRSLAIGGKAVSAQGVVPVENQAKGAGSMALGLSNVSYGSYSVAVGTGNETGQSSTTSSWGWKAVAVGFLNKAQTDGSIAIGSSNTSVSQYAIAMGSANTATANYSQAIGGSNVVNGLYSIGYGYANKVYAGTDAAQTAVDNAIAIGNTNKVNTEYSVSVGFENVATGGNQENKAIAMGTWNKASGLSAIAIGAGTSNGDPQTADGAYAIALGNAQTAKGTAAIAVGNANKALSNNSFAIGSGNNAFADNALALGGGNKTLGEASMAFGLGNEVISKNKNDSATTGYVETANSMAQGRNNHVYGSNSIAMGNANFIGGTRTKVSEDSPETDTFIIADKSDVTLAFGVRNTAAIGRTKLLDTAEKALEDKKTDRTSIVQLVKLYAGDDQAGQDFIKKVEEIDPGLTDAEWIDKLREKIEEAPQDAYKLAYNTAIEEGATEEKAQAAGKYAKAIAEQKIASSTVWDGHGMLIGEGNEVYGTKSLGFGTDNKVHSIGSIVLGGNNIVGDYTQDETTKAYTTDDDARDFMDMAIGTKNTIKGSLNVSMGIGNETYGTQTVSVGMNTIGKDSVDEDGKKIGRVTAGLAYGLNNEVYSDKSVAIGGTNVVNAQEGIGTDVSNPTQTTTIKAGESLAFGLGNTVNTSQAIVIGGGNTVGASADTAATVGANDAVTLSGREVVIGVGSNIGQNAGQSTALGGANTVSAANSVALGFGAQVSALNAQALGAGANAKGLNSVALGAGSSTTANQFDTVSVGGAQVDGSVLRRRIINVAYGQGTNDAAAYGQIAKLNQPLNFNAEDSTQKITTNGGDTVATLTIETGDVAAGDTGFTSGDTVYWAIKNMASIVDYDKNYKANGDHYLSTDFNQTFTKKGKDSAAYGYNANAQGDNSVAIGAGSVATEDDTFAVGSSTSKRRIVNVAAATKAGEATVYEQIAAKGQIVSGASITEPADDEEDKRTNVIRDNAGNTLVTIKTYDASKPKYDPLDPATEDQSDAYVTYGGMKSSVTNIVNENTIVDFDKDYKTSEKHWLSTDFDLDIDDSTKGTDSAAYGYGAKASGNNSVALGANSIATDANTVSFGHTADDTNPATGEVYGSALNRTLTNVAYGSSQYDGVAFGQILQKSDAGTSYVVDKDHNTVELKANDGTTLATIDVQFPEYNPEEAVDPFIQRSDENHWIDVKWNNKDGATVVRGENSVALGYQANAQGNNSVALGYGSIATEANTFSVGSTESTRKIVNVANGTDNTDAATYGQLADAQKQENGSYKVYEADDDGIVTIKTNDDNVAFKFYAGNGGSGTSIVDYDKNYGSTEGDHWLSTDFGNKANVDHGADSTAYGYGANAKGDQSVALGKDAKAEGTASIAVGEGASVTGTSSIALGDGASVTGNNSVAIGDGSKATGNNEVSFGTSDSKRKLTNVAEGEKLGEVAVYDQIAAKGQTVSGADITDGSKDQTNVIRDNAGNVLVTIATADPNATPTEEDKTKGTKYITESYFYKNMEQTVIDVVEENSIVDYDKNYKASGNHWLSTDFDQEFDTKGRDSTAYGYGANAQGANSVALGSGSVATEDNEVSFGNANLQRTLTNVAYGSSQYEAATYGQIMEADQTFNVSQTNNTVKLKANDGTTLATIDVQLPYDPITDPFIQRSDGDHWIDVKWNEGDGTSVVRGENSVALGYKANAQGNNSVALGYGSIATEANTFSVGSANSTRKIVNVAAGTANTDAATYGQLTDAQKQENGSYKVYEADDDGVVTVLTNNGDVAFKIAGGTGYVDPSEILLKNQTVSLKTTTGDDKDKTNVLRAKDGKTILATFEKGSVETDSTGFVSGGDVYNAIAAKNQTFNVSKDNNTAKILANDGTTLATINVQFNGDPDDPFIQRSDGDHWIDVKWNEGDGTSVVRGDNSVALGYKANAQGDNSVALGYGSIATEANTFSVGSANSTRKIVNVAAGTANTDAANVGQLLNSGTYDSKAGTITFSNKAGDEVFTVDGLGIGTGDVKKGDIAKLGQTVSLKTTTGEAKDKTNVILTNDGDVIATFEKGSVATGNTGFVSGGDVYNAIAAKNQTFNVSKDNNTAKILANDGTTLATINVQFNGDPDDPFIQRSDGDHWIDVKWNEGDGSDVKRGENSVALGYKANAQGDNSVALGYGSIATEANTFSVGSANSTRKIVNVAAGTADTDAANVGQLLNSGTYDSKAGTITFSNKAGDEVFTVDGLGIGTGDVKKGDIAKLGQTVSLKTTTGEAKDKTNVILTNDGDVIATFEKGSVATGNTGFVSGGDVFSAIAKKGQSISGKNNVIMANDGSALATIETADPTVINKEGDKYITEEYFYTNLEKYGDTIINQNTIVDFDKDYKTSGDHYLSTDFDKENVEHGKDSAAYGYGANAKGDESVAIGKDAVAEGKGSIAIGSGSVATGDNEVSFGTADNKRKLTNVAEGTALGDVAVYDQIAAKGQKINGDNTNIMANDGKTVLVTIETADPDVKPTDEEKNGNKYITQKYFFKNLEEYGDTLIEENTIVDFDKDYKESGNHYLSTDFDKTFATKGLDSTAYGYGANAQGNNSVAIGSGSIATEANTFSVGSEGNERKIVNVATGTAVTDAANVGQIAAHGQDLNINGLKNTEYLYDENGALIAKISVQGLPNPDSGFSIVDFSKNEHWLSTDFDITGVKHGVESTAFGYKAEAAGERATAIGYGSKAEADHSTAVGYGNEATGEHSTAVGDENKTGGDKSAAYGYHNEASGDNSTAIGTYSKAEGDNSVAMGNGAEAKADNSMAFGTGSVADEEKTASFGHKDADGNWEDGYRITNIADGKDAHDAATVGQVNKIYDEIGNRTKYFNYDEDQPAIIIGDPEKNIADGKNTTSIGFETEAKGEGATAIGDAAKATGDHSTALGYNSKANSNHATALGDRNNITGEYSTGVGALNTVNGQHSIAAGCDNDVQGDYAVALGHNNKVTGNNAIVIGKDGTAGKDGIVIGNNSSAKEGSTAIGNDSVAKDSNEVSIGHSKGDTYTDPDSGETKTYDSDLNRKITHVADGTSDHDAANVGQVNKIGERVTEVEKKVDGFDSRISDVETSSGRGIAGASALAALHPLEFDPDDKASFAVGYGHFKSSDALALGAFYRPNESVLFSVGGVLGNGEDQFNAGISFALGRDDKRTHPMGRVEMSRRIQSLQQENAGLTDRIDRLERFIVQMVQNGQQQKPEEAAQPIPTV